MKPAFLASWLFVTFLMAGSDAFSAPGTARDFVDVREVHIETKTGDVIITKSADDKVHLVLTPPSREKDFETQIRQDRDRLWLKEVRASDSWLAGTATWRVALPDDLSLNVATGSGDVAITGVNAGDVIAALGSGRIRIEDVKGDIDVAQGSGNSELANVVGDIRIRTGSGAVKIDHGTGDINIAAGSDRVTLKDVTGALQVVHGSGDIRGKSLSLTGESTFISGSGDIALKLASSLDDSVKLVSGSGNAIIDYNGFPLSGIFILRAGLRHGKISAPFPFDDEYIDYQSGDPAMVKTARIGADYPEVSLTTGSGKARIIE